ncbi:Protein CSF1 [Psilocybe cubensis]|uniref:Protein CSF1 n=1 Tax=Psilocybe cubensis TaxID=181762 RepID=A0ACB8HBP1_PSICU|nr:Protein CSF1 [Psilocybe cubensis]KAH9485425.1 Protein CSF1 [Psilocybe cubensis]
MLNLNLLGICIAIVAALIFYFFYWNRFIAYVIGQTIRILSWNQESPIIRIDIGSIHFSILAGRILLKDVSYHSSNQTVKVVKGQIQWRYWIRRPTLDDDISPSRGENGKEAFPQRSCRIQLTFEGVEWFIYNRTAAYDTILEEIDRTSRPTSRSSSHYRLFRRFSRQGDTSILYPPSAFRSSIYVPKSIQQTLKWLRSQLPTLDPKDLLPFGIEIRTGAIVLGNPSTPHLLVSEFQSASGTFGIVPSRSKHDLYKQVLNLKFRKPSIRLVHNDDYVDPMTVVGSLVHGRLKHHSTLRKPYFYQPYRAFVKIWRQMNLYSIMNDYFSTRRIQRANTLPVRPSTTSPKLKKGTDEDTPIGIDFSTFEYAIERKILEAPILDLTYYVDIVGEVPPQPNIDHRHGSGVYDVHAGDTPPEWGFDIVIYGGLLRYGPWADRQRIELQRIFFPPSYLDLAVTPILKPGEKRVWANLQVFIELRDSTTLHVPFREASKDWQWDGKVEYPQRPRVREAASIIVDVGDRSSINYIMPMVVGPTGYESTFEVHLDTVSITSSLNDIHILSAESCRVRGELPSPIRWDALRTWSIAVYLRQPVLFLLRDHIDMFTDLARDWVAGPPTEYQKFIPMIYTFKLEMHHFQLNLYANDQNIVDKPLIKDENALLSLTGPHLKNTMTIPSNKFRPESTSIPFYITTPHVSVKMSLPRWNTHARYAPQDGIDLLEADLLSISGSYLYFSSVMAEYVEQLKIQFDLRGVVFRAYGWSIRYFMVLRDNYLGSFTHFQTLSEYLDKRKKNAPVGDPVAQKYRPGKANMLQVELFLHVNDSNILLPIPLIGMATHATDGTIPTNGTSRHLNFHVPEFQLQLRLHDYYMEMSLNLETITGTIYTPPSIPDNALNERIVLIDGIDVTANRLFGPQPRTATYVCMWEISVGKVKASLTANDANVLASAIHSFRLNFVDVVNAPAHDFMPAVDPDVTFYKVTVKPIELTWKSERAALYVQLPHGLVFDSNDLGAHQYRSVMALRIHQLNASVLLASSTERKNQWLEAASVLFDMDLDIYSSPTGHRGMTRKQLLFIEEQDKPTGRAKFMFNQLRQRIQENDSLDQRLHRGGVFLPQPSLPGAFCDNSTSYPSLQSHTHRTRPPSWRLSTFTNLSDSEEEEAISEVDRDARLARTRTSTPAPETRTDDVTMSSGDESDDADLTDGDSIWSDIEDIDGDGISSMLLFYSSIVKQYSSNWVRSSDSWDGAAFTSTRNSASFLSDFDNNETETCFRPVFECTHVTLPEDLPKDTGVTAFRVNFNKKINVLFTPLLIPAVACFEEDINNIALTHGMVIDSLLVTCLSQAKGPAKMGYRILDLNVTSLTVQMLQHIGVSDEATLGGDINHEALTPRNLDITAITKVAIRGARLLGTFGRQIQPNIDVVIDRFIGTVDVSIDKRTLDSSMADPTIVALTISSSVLKISQHSMRQNHGVIDIRLGNRGPEIITATATAMSLSGMHFMRRAKTLQRDQLSNKRAMIGNLLKVTEKHPVIDSLSITQPSYLVQTGIPHVLRTDATFRLLYHLRNTLWSMDEDENSLLHQSTGKVQLQELLTLVQSRLTLLDQDICSVDHLSSISFFLSDEKPNHLEQSTKYSLSVLTLLVGTSTITILAPSGKTSSRLNIDNLAVEVQPKLSQLIQFNFNNPSSASQTSLRSKTSRSVQQAVIVLSVHEITLIVSPHLMYFAQHVLRVTRQFQSSQVNVSTPKYGRGSWEKSYNSSSKLWHIELIGTVHRLRIQAGAENLIVVMGIQGLQTASTMLTLNKRTIQSMNHSILFNQVFLQARSPANPAKENEQDILASLAFNTARISVIAKPEDTTTNLKLVFALAGLQLHVPRSALRLYHFVGEWRADYLPGMEAAVKTLLSEYNSGPRRPYSPPVSRSSSKTFLVQIHGQITHFEISLQVMHGTWLSWEVNKTVAYIDSSPSKRNGGQYAFGLQITSMIFTVSSKPNIREAMSSSRVKLVFPPASLAGYSDGIKVHTLVLFEFLELKVKPSHWDTLLSVQQKFGQDFNDLVALMQQKRQKTPISRKSKPATPKMSFQYEGHIKMQGFRIGLEGVASSVLLECQNIVGEISNTDRWSWGLDLSDLALSLAPRTHGLSDSAFNRDQRSAFVIVDFKFNGSGSGQGNEKKIGLIVSKVHAVMQPSSIGELGDFIDNLQIEMLERQNQRASELATFKEKAQRILKTFDVNIGEVQTVNESWFQDMVIDISIQSVGIAFPLIYDEELTFAHIARKEINPIRAFLFSIQSIHFGIHRGDSGQAIMQHLSFQFISRFRQSVTEDFSAESHRTRNHLLYPKMTAQLRSTRTGSSTKIWIDADGKERVERLSANTPRTPFPSTPLSSGSKLSVPEKSIKTIPASQISANLVFHSGKVRLYSASASNLFKTKTISVTPPWELTDEQISDLGAEIFELPIVSVWAEYRAMPASQKIRKESDPEPSVLIFNSTVHSSNNILRPILLPFLTELVDHVETRLRKIGLNSPKSSSVLLPDFSSTDFLPRTEEDENSISSLQICFSLRIDKSKLELTCQPDVNVVAGLHWDSGGFVLNMTPGARKVSFFGSVGGLTVGLKHGFLSEDCVKLDARDLAFSVSLQRMDSESGHSISIVLDTEFLGGVRFSRLQDILCFKAVWLDRIPLFNQAPQDAKTPLRTADTELADVSSLQGRMSTIVLVRIRKIKLEVDLGQSISKIGLELADSVLRMKLTDDINDVFLFIGDVSTTALGNLSGHAQVSSCVFQTTRRSEIGIWDDLGRGKMLELKLTSGPLVIELESDRQKLLHYRAQPLGVEVYDDWSRAHPQGGKTSRPLQLSFTVTCPEIVAAVTVGTIPKLLSHANKFKANLDAQRQGAFRESQTFRATRTPKPDNPLSAVAEAMLQSAKSRFKETDMGLSYIIRQHMSLRLDTLRLIVFPRTMRDVEIAHFIARDVAAQLNGLLSTDMAPGSRDLVLSFSSMIISRYTQVTHPPVALSDSTRERTEPEWPDSLFKDAIEATIVGLPSMKMHMLSEEVIEETGKILTYDFYSQFVRRVGMKAFEDIYITLNVSLYSWLTVLRKNLARELDQVRATEDWRTSISNMSTTMISGASARKKKVPDPLSLVDSPRSASLPSAGTAGLSPYAPSSARHGWLDHNRSPQIVNEQYLSASPSPLQSESIMIHFPPVKDIIEDTPASRAQPKRATITYRPRERHIERLTMRQLGEATPDVMHPFFMKKAGFNLEDSLPQYVNEYAVVPLEEIMEVLLKLYSQQLLVGTKRPLFVNR